MCIIFGCNPQISFLFIFLQFGLSHFLGLTSAEAYRHWVSREPNFSYNFTGIFLKVCKFFRQGLKMCILRFNNSAQIILCYFFKSIFSSTSTKAYIHWVSCHCNSSYCFSLMVFEILQFFVKILHDISCKSSDYVLSLFLQFKHSHFFARPLPKYRHWVSCERNSFYNFSKSPFETLQVLLSRSEDVHGICL